jgi:hypothetical protein
MEKQSSVARLGQADPFRTLNSDCRAGRAIDSSIDGPVILPWGRLERRAWSEASDEVT